MAAFLAGDHPHNGRRQIDRFATLKPQNFAIN